MYCKTCGNPMNDNQAICLNCGCATGTGNAYCSNCGGQLAPNAVVCMGCGVAADYGAAKKAGTAIGGDWCPAGKEKIVVILLAFFVGGLGIHNFYLGESKKGILKLLTCWIGIGSILALIDFIKMLMNTYVVDPDKLI